MNLLNISNMSNDFSFSSQIFESCVELPINSLYSSDSARFLISAYGNSKKYRKSCSYTTILCRYNKILSSR